MGPMSIPQLASEMGVSRVTVWQRVRRGQIAAARVGRNYVISADTVREVLGLDATPERTRRVSRAVSRAVEEYGELLKWLGAR